MASQLAMDTVTETFPVVHQNGNAHRDSPDTRPAAAVLRLHFYHSSQGGVDCSLLSYPPGDYVAEELCIDAAKACSEYSARVKHPHSCVLCNSGHKSQDKVIKRPQ